MGTILVLFVYVLAALSLPVFMWRRHRDSFSVLRYVAMPTLGALALVIPFVELFEPGQPAPYSVFPYLSVAILIVAAAIASYVVRRNPQGRCERGPDGGLNRTPPRLDQRGIPATTTARVCETCALLSEVICE